MTRQRLLAINAVLTRRGLKWLATEVGLQRLLPNNPLVGTRAEVTAESLRLALEELGTTFIKFGQVLSTRPDLLSADYILELQKLQDRVASVPYPQMEAVFESEIGFKPQEVFASFNPVPRASASIGQVYDAVTKDGLPVVVKIQRPGLEELCNQDINILREMATLLVRSPVGERVDLIGAVEEFAASLQRELDFRIEARNANTIRTGFKHDPVVRIPQIVSGLTTKRVLTEERISGIRIDDLVKLDEMGFDRHELAKNCCHIALTQIFEHRFFHADPHPGNFFVLEGGAIGMIDFGMVGRIDPKTRDNLARLIPAVSQGDADDLAESILELGLVSGKVDRGRFSRDLQRLIDEYSGKDLGDISLGKIGSQLVEIMRRHGLQMPSNLLLLVRVLSIDEGNARKLDPGFQLTEFAAPYFKKFWMEQFSPLNLAKQQSKNMADLLLTSKGGLKRITRLVSSLERGDLTVGVNIERISGPNEELRAATRQLTRAILLGASIIAAGLIWVGLRMH
jgi:ubiquinone biosynthesis protein